MKAKYNWPVDQLGIILTGAHSRLQTCDENFIKLGGYIYSNIVIKYNSELLVL